MQPMTREHFVEFVRSAGQGVVATERDKCGQIYVAQFPGARALDDEFSIVRVVPQWLRYYDAREAFALVREGECW